MKRPIKDDNEQVQNEYRIYDLLDKHPNPNVVRSFYRIPSANCLQYMSGGTLDQRLRKHQTRDPIHNLVVNVNHKEPAHLVWRWMAELIDAAAWLECLGYAHGDLRPTNLLLDSEDHLKVADFDSTTAIGTVFDGLQPPYARVLGDEAAEARGTFGYHGPRTEQFAIGTLVYYMTRGCEPYDSEWLGEGHEERVVDRLQAMVFPPTSNAEIDTIIRKCWHGKFISIQRLNTEVIHARPVVLSSLAKALDKAECDFASRQCRRLIAQGVLDQAHRGLVILP
ncbi:MAG: hypothetical protein Q9201_006433 [Fulgogasparrea decipioides]